MILSSNPRFSKHDIQLIGEELKRFGATGFTAQQVVNLARPANSPLHKFFEWDDSIAAEKYRESQARMVISAVCYIRPGLERPVREYHCVATINDTRYLGTDEVKADVELSEQVVSEAQKELIRWRNRYSDYSKFFGIYAAIDELINERT